MRTELPYSSSHQASLECGPPPEYDEEPMMVEFVVPVDAYPGTKLEFVTPDGQELRLTVPDGVPPGSVMTLTQDFETGQWRCMAEPMGGQEDPQATTAVPEALAAYEVAQAAAAATLPAVTSDTPTVRRHTAQSQGGSAVSSAARAATITYAAPVQGPTVMVSRPSYTPPPVMAIATPSYTPPPAVVASVSMRPPSYVPPPAVQPAMAMRPSYTPPPVVMEQRHSYTPPPMIVRETRPSYSPPPMAVLEQRPSYTPIPQVLQGGACLPARALPHSDAQMMATTVAIQPQQLAQHLSQASSYVPPPAHALQGRLSYVPPPMGPSITTLPTQEMPRPARMPHMGMQPQGQMMSGPSMGMQQMPPHMGAPMGNPQMGLPPIGLHGMSFIQPHIGLPPLGLLSAPPPGGGLMGSYMQQDFATGMGPVGGGGHLGAVGGPPYGGLQQYAPLPPPPGQFGAYGGPQAGLHPGMNHPPLMACG